MQESRGVPVCLLCLMSIFVTTTSTLFDNRDLRPITWTGGPLEWPCQSSKGIYKNSGRYVSKNVIATRVQIYKDDAIVVMPRYRPGVPVTLAKTSLKNKNCHATFSAFPCWNLQEEGSCQSLQSAVDIFLDSNNILWVLDVGMVDTLEKPIKRCPPKVVGLDVVTGKILKVIDLSELVSSVSRLQYLVVEYKEGRSYVYVSDAGTKAIIVYDVSQSRGYRVVLPKSVIEGCERRDVLYIALVRKSCGATNLIFTYLSGTRMFSIKTDYLRRGSASGRVHDLGLKPDKMVILGTDSGSAVFFRYEGSGDIYRWDSSVELKQENFYVVYNSESCSLATHVVADNKRGRLRVLESNFPDYLQGTVGCGAMHTLSVLQYQDCRLSLL